VFATLPCENINVIKQAIHNKLQGSVATYLGCGGLVGILITKLRKVYCKVCQWIFFKSVNVWQSFKQEGGCLMHFVRLATTLLEATCTLVRFYVLLRRCYYKLVLNFQFVCFYNWRLWGRNDGVAPTGFGRGAITPTFPHRVNTYGWAFLLQKEKAQGFRERLQSIQDVLLQVQDTMDQVASTFERVKK